MRKRPLILQSDFGTSDGAVSAMYGVAYGVDQELKISDLTHEIRYLGGVLPPDSDPELLAGGLCLRQCGRSGRGFNKKKHCCRN